MTQLQQFTVDIVPLNSADPFNSNASGSATLTLAAPSDNIRTLDIEIEASGLQDLSEFGGIHVAHIHGQFEGNAERPLLEQGDGSFFEGEGGTAVNSTLPQLESDDINDNGFLNFLEGRPSYGPVTLNLTSTQLAEVEGGSFAPEGTPPLTHFLNLAGAGEINPAELFPSGTEFNLDTTYTFDLSEPDQLRQFNNLTPLEDREIVLHGLTVPQDLSDAIDEAAQGNAPEGVEVSNGEAFRITAPVAAGTIEKVSEESKEPVFGSLEADTLEAGVNANLDGNLVFTGEGNDKTFATGSPGGNRIYGGNGEDELEASTEDRIFAGAGNDTLEASVGSGNNRLYGGEGNDILVAGTRDRVIGGEGNDRFFLAEGEGDNTVTGSAGADQFFLATAQFAGEANIITDFSPGEDILNLTGVGLEFGDLTIATASENENNTVISAENQDLAILLGVQAETISEANLAFE